MACFWELSIEYSKQLTNPLQLLERELLGHDTGKVTAMVNQWSTRPGAGAMSFKTCLYVFICQLDESTPTKKRWKLSRLMQL